MIKRHLAFENVQLSNNIKLILSEMKSDGSRVHHKVLTEAKEEIDKLTKELLKAVSEGM